MKMDLHPSSLLAAFFRDRRASSAVEFAIVASPFIFLILGILQIGLYYMVQSSLDAGLVKTADTLRSGFTSTAPSFPNAAALKTMVATNAGGLIHNDSSLAVEIRQLTTLDGAVLPVTDGTSDYGSTSSTLVIRAQSSVITFTPGLGALANVRSSAIVRRQGT